MNHLITVTKHDGTKQLFEEEKLVDSLRRVGASEQAIDEIVEAIEHEMTDGMQTGEIYARAFALLKKHHGPTAVRYSLRRALFDLGPDGFPFEAFVARIFKLWGYDAVTDQTLMGECVEHEVDVVAWKGEELSMVEAKFHNEIGLRSDVKVALYVKARFDDLTGIRFSYGGKERALSSDGRWLITNTKFTDQAIKYGACKGLKLVGWNYPAKGSLHQIIEENGLFPVTALSSLSHQERTHVIGEGVLTCIDVIGNPDVLKRIGVKADNVDRVLAEAQLIVENTRRQG